MQRRSLAPLALAAVVLLVCSHIDTAAAGQQQVAGRLLLQEPDSVNQTRNASAAAEERYRPVIEAISEFLTVTQSRPNATTNRTNFWAPRIIRLAWHAAGTYDPDESPHGGSDGATMRFFPESRHVENNGLNVSRGQLEQFKEEFPWISYADLWTLAGCVAIKNMGGPRMKWRPGRVDAPDNTTSPPDGRLPDAALGRSHMRDIFGRMNLTDRETVALIGAHSVGGCRQEVSGYQGQWTLTPQAFNNLFFQNMLNQTWNIRTMDGRRRWEGKRQWESGVVLNETLPGTTIVRQTRLMMLPTDLELRDDPDFLVHVKEFAANQTAFFEAFATTFRKVLELGVTFENGEDEVITV